MCELFVDCHSSSLISRPLVSVPSRKARRSVVIIVRLAPDAVIFEPGVLLLHDVIVDVWPR